MDARKVDFLERFTGVTWAQRGTSALVGEDASLGLKKAWAGVAQMMLNRLLIQGPLQGIFANARYDFVTDSIKLNDTLETLLARAKTYAAQAGQAAGEFWKLFGGILAEHKAQFGASLGEVDAAILKASGIALYMQEVTLTAADGALYTGKNGAPETLTLYTFGGGAGDDAISGSGTNDYLFGRGGTDGLHNVAGSIVTDKWMPGAEQFSPNDFTASIQSLQTFFGPSIPADSWNLELAGASLANLTTFAYDYLAIDPLVLDLNGDGVQLTSYAESPVLFDIDHDGSTGSPQAQGSKEVTGWVSSEDGIVVMDLNNNGQIDDISETMSEYFTGTVGAGGTAGTKPYANGFAALKSLDSNADNQFTSADTAFTNVKVWTDANHNGQTDTGELKTLTELTITSINLASTNQSGLVSGGNEILASGTFTQNGSAKEAQAANFIANPDGHSFTTSGNGTLIATQGSGASYVSHSATGESIDLATIVAGGVANTTGGTGNDTLIGTADSNWLADISTLTIGNAPFSNPGASILVSAPDSNVARTSRILLGDDGTASERMTRSRRWRDGEWNDIRFALNDAVFEMRRKG